MNDGWESPVESSDSTCVAVQNPQRNNQNRRTYSRRHVEHSVQVDETWGDVETKTKSYGNNQDKSSRFSNRRRNLTNDPFIQIAVPSNMVGKIIGRGGCKISELQDVSGARIIITKEEVDNKVTVKLFGEEDMTNRAKELIENIIEFQPPRQTIQSQHQKFYAPSNEKHIRQPMQINWKELSEECDRLEKEKWDKCPPIIKNFYTEHPEVSAMNDKQVQQFRLKNNNIVVSRVFLKEGEIEFIPKPVVTFEQALNSWPELLEEVNRAGFERPSPIQSQSWPALFAGEDMIGIAQTGTGKTLAFLLPALVHIEGQPVPREQRTGANVLILAPTRELALQIEREVNKYRYRDISAVCLYGGASRREQVNTVTRGVEIIIATPGRLNDLVLAGHVDLSAITYLVLDEADRMLDMGFEPQIRKVLMDIRPDRQTVMTSATWPSGVRRLAHSYMRNPLQIYVGSLDLAAVHSVTQTIVIMDGDGEGEEDEKFRYFMNWVYNMEATDKVIVFCGKKSRADHVASELASLGIDCASLHGDREQADREQAVADIASGAVRVLIATDLASRGLDIVDLTHVFNYDFPRHVEEYVHRVGRTGRAGRKGEAISLVTRGDWAHASELVNILEEADQYVPEPLRDMARRYAVWQERRNADRRPRTRY